MGKKPSSLIPTERIEQAILLIRGQKVMLDSDLAALYGVTTSQLVQAVKRNADRFPADFAYRLTSKEFTILKSQSVISSSGWGGRRRPPYASTEQGVAMLSSVLHSKRAVQVNVDIMRVFVRLRELLSSHAEIGARLAEMEKKYDRQFAIVFDAIRQLATRPTTPSNEMGYHTLIEDRGPKQ